MGLKPQGNSGSCLWSSTSLSFNICLIEIFSERRRAVSCLTTNANLQDFFFLRSQSLCFGYFSSLPNILTSALGNLPTVYFPVGISWPFPLRSGSSTAIKHILADKTVTKHLIVFFPVNPGLCLVFFFLSHLNQPGFKHLNWGTSFAFLPLCGRGPVLRARVRAGIVASVRIFLCYGLGLRIQLPSNVSDAPTLQVV